MARHHYVPRFLLRRWSTDGRFVAYYWDDASKRAIENDKATVASACQIPDLNTFFGVSKSQRDFPESGFFTPHVDTPAAVALRVMLSDGVRALTSKQRIDWARLLVSFGVRMPETLRDMGPTETKKAFDLVETTAKGPPEDERKVSALVQQNLKTFQRNFPLQAAIEISLDPAKLAAVNGMQWWSRRWDRDAILIGDRPLLTAPRMRYPCGIPLNDPSCLIFLPIAPDAVFFASAHPKTRAKVRRMAQGKLARIVNEESIWRSTSVYAANRSMASFIMPKLTGKANNTWQPSTI
jgi:Protein of unknown function (DUF4238)